MSNYASKNKLIQCGFFILATLLIIFLPLSTGHAQGEVSGFFVTPDDDYGLSFDYSEPAMLSESADAHLFGERPEIDLASVPADAMEEGKMYIKFTPDMTALCDLNQDAFAIAESGIALTGIEGLDRLNTEYGVTGITSLFNSIYNISEASLQYRDRHREYGFHLWYEFDVSTTHDIREVVAAYNSLKQVEIAEPVYKTELHTTIDDYPAAIERFDAGQGDIEPSWTPNDPGYPDQWHYDNEGQTGGRFWADIDMRRAWDLERGSTSVIVAIIDSAVQANHADLNQNMWRDGSRSGYNFVRGENIPTNTLYAYRHNHGTHVAGTVAAVSNNSIGVAGIAGGSGWPNYGVRLMSLAIYSPPGAGQWESGDLLSGGHHTAHIFAADNGAAIAQNSWSYTNPGDYNTIVLDAIDYFNRHGGGSVMYGGLTVYSAGNSNDLRQYYPGAYSGAMAVAATNHSDRRSWYSNYGSWVEIAAPGGETPHSLAPPGTTWSMGVLSTNANSPSGTIRDYGNESYRYMQGTSMACPHVSGAAALMISHRPGHYRATQVRRMLTQSTERIDQLNPSFQGLLGTGRLNAYFALLRTRALRSVIGMHTFGFYDWSDGRVYVKYGHSPGPADATYRLGPRNNNWVVARGDWNGNGIHTFGFYDRRDGRVYIKYNHTPGPADATYRLGPRGNNWVVRIGDFNGDGRDTFGFYDRSDGRVYVKYNHSPGPADATYRLGPRGNNWAVLVGDFNNNGRKTFGFYDWSEGRVYVKYDHAPGAADSTYRLGPRRNSWAVGVADWNGNGQDTFGFYDRRAGQVYVKFNHSPGAADATYRLGPRGNDWSVFAGDFNNNGSATFGFYDRRNGQVYAKFNHSPGPADATYRLGPRNNNWGVLVGGWR